MKIMTLLGRLASFLLVILGLSLSMLAGAASKPNQLPVWSKAESVYPDQVFWGDTHLHTNLSLDAYARGYTQMGPEEAYRFAQGEAMRVKARFLPEQTRRLHRPLDFLVIADHAENLGLFANLAANDPVLLQSADGRHYRELMQQADTANSLAERARLFNQFAKAIYFGDTKVGTESYRRGVWSDITERADVYNQPGKFTTFSAFEWTPQSVGAAPHRVVLFADAADKVSQVQPFSKMDSKRPEDLWAYLEGYQQKTGGDVLAILHGSNISYGQGTAFSLLDSDGEPFSAAYSLARQRFEPLAEVTQTKGDSEAHPLLSPDDEFANFERWNTWLGSHYATDKLDAFWQQVIADAVTPETLQYKYVRPALKLGLAQEARVGVNPFKFGLVGGTDSHNGLSNIDNDNYGLASPERLLKLEAGDLRQAWEKGAAGYTGIWAHENTRQALFDAMKRKEVYASTGPRIKLRFFGGWNFEADDALRPDLARIGYTKGVPMGSDLSSALPNHTPSFLIRAVKDPEGANLDRLQVIKGWLDQQGNLQEKIYSVALSDAREIDADGNIKKVGNSVNIKQASYLNSIGDPELAVVWQDPDFNSQERAFYYARVIEIPTPRWTAYDAKSFGHKNIPEQIPLLTQERAYSSPIWYVPE